MSQEEYCQQEKDEDIVYLDTAQDWNENWPDDEIKTIVGIVASHFKFGYGGFNGLFREREEMLREIQDQIDFRTTRGAHLNTEKGN